MGPTDVAAPSSGRAGPTRSENIENPDRRAVIGCCFAAAVVGAAPGVRAADEDDPDRSLKPKKGDLFVYLEGDREGQVVKADDIKAGDPSFMAWPYDPAKKIPRDGSRLNLALFARLDPATIGEDHAQYAADGFVAFAATCTHQQCPVAEWLSELQLFQCPCHQSRFDPKQGAQVVSGPAPRPLPRLPIKIADGALQVAGPFVGRVGGMLPGTG